MYQARGEGSVISTEYPAESGCIPCSGQVDHDGI